MPSVDPASFHDLYECFQSPIFTHNCGERCAPYNEKGVPFCCDINHAVPSAYQPEWEYLSSNTDLWHLWKPNNPHTYEQLKEQSTPDQVLIECLGHKLCKRDFRSITCRAFPFFPYINEQDDFVGLTYYWEYADRCWIISNLHIISVQFRNEFIAAYDILFDLMPKELATFRHQSKITRRTFTRRNRSIPLLHRDGFNYKLSPRTGRMRHIQIGNLPKYGPYKIASELPYLEEINDY
jgi:hypothetical protein